jgi:hypothetical protein
MNSLTAAGRLTVVVLVLAFSASCAQGAGTPATTPSNAPLASGSPSLSGSTSAKPDSTPSASGPSTDSSEPPNGLPYTVVATDGPPLYGHVYSATKMSALPQQASAKACASSATCYATATPPASSLLLLFEPAAADCQQVTGYAVFLLQGTLRIAVSGSDDCPSPPAGALRAAPSTLLAIPLQVLPAAGKLAITITPFGRRFGAPPEETTTIDLG